MTIQNFDSLSQQKKVQQAYYAKNRQRIIDYASKYYTEHKESVLAKAKVRYATTKKKTYFCKVCGTQLPAELSGHHLYCPEHRPVRKSAKKQQKEPGV